MKTEDIARLKEICEREGFKLEIPGEAYFSGKQAFTITKKDPWQDVEFAELTTNFELLDLYIGIVGKVISIHDDRTIGVRQVNGSTLRVFKGYFKPSTEQAYFEQLKKEAFERFGEINHKDVFEIPEGGTATFYGQGLWNEPFTYWKEYDRLTYCGFIIYQSGKWATRVSEKVKVSFCWKTDERYDRVYFNFHKNTGCEFEIGPNLFTDDNPAKVKEIGQFLSKQLEKYLNNETN